MTKNQKLFKKAFFVMLAGIIMISAPPVYSEGDVLHAHTDENAVIVTAPVLLDRSALVPIEPLQNPSRAALYSVDDCEHNDTYFIDYYYMHPHNPVYGCDDCGYVFWDYSTTYPGNYEGCEENTAILNVYWSTTGSNYTHLKTYTSTEIATFCNTYSTTVSEHGTPAGYTFSGTSYITDAQGTGRTAGSSATVYFNESSLYGHVRFTYVASSCTHPNLSNATPNLEHTSLGHRVNYTCLDCNASVLSFVPLTGCGLCYPGQCQHLLKTVSIDASAGHDPTYDGHAIYYLCSYCNSEFVEISRKPCSECWDCHEPVETYGPHVIGQGHTYSSICEYCDGDYISPYSYHNIAGCDDCMYYTSYLLKNVGTNTYLTVHMGYDKNNQNIYVAPRETNETNGTQRDAQEFKLKYHAQRTYSDGNSAENVFTLNAVCSQNGNNRMVDIVRNSAALAAGQNAQLFTAYDVDATSFVLTQLSNGYYTFAMAKDPTLVLTANAGAGTGTGTASSSAGNVYIDTYSSNDTYQQWILEPCTEENDAYYANVTLLYPLGSYSPYTEITSDFGWRYLTYNNTGDQFHNGMDITSNGANPTLYAPFDGTIKLASYGELGGNQVVIESNDILVANSSTIKLRVIYMHMDSIIVNKNDQVNAGSPVGTVGTTGQSSGEHLHLGVIVTGGTISTDNHSIDPYLCNIVDPATGQKINFTYN